MDKDAAMSHLLHHVAFQIETLFPLQQRREDWKFGLLL